MAEITQADRDLLAAEFDALGLGAFAITIRNGEPVNIMSKTALTAIATLRAENEKLKSALTEAYGVLCAGKPPHSARESNARKIIRDALGLKRPLQGQSS